MLMITQPTFFPWLGYFDMIDQSDIFVILDDAKFSKRSWHQRNKFKKLFKSTNELEWFTIPVQSEKSDNNINQIKMFNEIKILKEFEKFIQTNYSKSKYFKSYSKNIINTMILESKKGMLSDLNIGIIKFFLEVLNIKTKIILSSDLSLKGKRSKKTINICEYFKEKIYLSSPGSKEYLIQDAELFDNATKKLDL